MVSETRITIFSSKYVNIATLIAVLAAAVMRMVLFDNYKLCL
jgi:hypothetical protein